MLLRDRWPSNKMTTTLRELLLLGTEPGARLNAMGLDYTAPCCAKRNIHIQREVGFSSVCAHKV